MNLNRTFSRGAGCAVLALAVLLPAGAFGDGDAPRSEPTPFLPSRYQDAFIASAGNDLLLRIGLVDCIAYALRKNSEIRIQRIEPQIRAEDVAIAAAAFEPALTAGYIITDSSQPTVNALLPEVLDTRAQETQAAVSGKLNIGLEYSLGVAAGPSHTNIPDQRFDPAYEASPSLVLTQPLLKGFGTAVNRAEIVIAQNNLAESSADFRNTVMEVITRAQAAYYAYAYALESYSLDDLSLRRARDLHAANQARYAKGLASSVDLLETGAAVAQREKALISAESLRQKTEDALKFVTNLVDDPELWNARIELIERAHFTDQTADLALSLTNAFTFRPDYLSALIDLESRDIRITVAKNAVLPVLDLFGSYALNGLGEGYREAFESWRTDRRDWSAGVSLRVPWGGGDRANLRAKEKEKEQALLSFQRLEQQIILEIRNRVREVEIQSRQVQAAATVRDKEALNYAAQQERYLAGHVSTHDILDYQDRLTQAELDYLQALIAHALALITLDQSQGLTLTKNNIQIEE